MSPRKPLGVTNLRRIVPCFSPLSKIPCKGAQSNYREKRMPVSTRHTTFVRLSTAELATGLGFHPVEIVCADLEPYRQFTPNAAASRRPGTASRQPRQLPPRPASRVERRCDGRSGPHRSGPGLASGSGMGPSPGDRAGLVTAGAQKLRLGSLTAL